MGGFEARSGTSVARMVRQDLYLPFAGLVASTQPVPLCHTTGLSWEDCQGLVGTPELHPARTCLYGAASVPVPRQHRLSQMITIIKPQPRPTDPNRDTRVPFIPAVIRWPLSVSEPPPITWTTENFLAVVPACGTAVTATAHLHERVTM